MVKRVGRFGGAIAFVCAFGLGFAANAEEQTNSHAHSHTQTAETQPEVTIGSETVSGPVSVLMGVGGFSGGNVAVSAGEDGLLIVDSKLAPMSGKLEAKLAELKTCDSCGDLKFLINTHWHFDHAGGNGHFGDRTVIVAHDNVRKLMSADQTIDFFQAQIPAAPKQALPVVTFADSMSIHFNGEEIQIRHLPNGHTETDSVIYFTESKVLHAGDIFFNGMFPFVDSQHGGDVKQLARNVQTLLDSYPADTKVIPGHGPMASMEDLRRYLDMLKATTAHVEAGMKAGKDLEALKAAGLPAGFESWAWMIDAQGWTTLLHASLSRS